MRYRWDLDDDGDVARWPTDQLTPDDIPQVVHRDADRDAVTAFVRFVHTFDGYRWAGSVERLDQRYWDARARFERDGTLPDDVDEIRALLFMWARIDRNDGGWGPKEAELGWFDALTGRLRELVRA